MRVIRGGAGSWVFMLRGSLDRSVALAAAAH
jgi:hypothetical protein